MKNIINIFLLLPILIYVVLLLINYNLLIETEEVNFFWIYTLNIPIITIISSIFIVYIFGMYFSGKLSIYFTNNKLKKLKKENLELKGKLADLIPEINKSLDNKIKKFIEDFKTLTDKSLDLHKKETNKVLGNLEYEIKDLKEKLNKK